MLMQNQNHWILLIGIHGAVRERHNMIPNTFSVEEEALPGSQDPSCHREELPVTPLSSPNIYVIGNTFYIRRSQQQIYCINNCKAVREVALACDNIELLACMRMFWRAKWEDSSAISTSIILLRAAFHIYLGYTRLIIGEV